MTSCPSGRFHSRAAGPCAGSPWSQMQCFSRGLRPVTAVLYGPGGGLSLRTCGFDPSGAVLTPCFFPLCVSCTYCQGSCGAGAGFDLQMEDQPVKVTDGLKWGMVLGVYAGVAVLTAGQGALLGGVSRLGGVLATVTAHGGPLELYAPSC
jgi:hypothetical protein